jgi:hypothetical protein
VQQRGLANLLVIDPPWENASARRSGRYATLTPNHLLHMPVKQLLKQVSAVTLQQQAAAGVLLARGLLRRGMTHGTSEYGKMQTAHQVWLCACHSLINIGMC